MCDRETERKKKIKKWKEGYKDKTEKYRVIERERAGVSDRMRKGEKE